MASKQPRKPGRPRLGPHGTRVSDYPRVMLRLSPPVAAELKAWSVVRDLPAWRLIEEAVIATLRNEPPEIQDAVRKLAPPPIQH